MAGSREGRVDRHLLGSTRDGIGPRGPATAVSAPGAVVLHLRGHVRRAALDDLGRWLDDALSGTAPVVGVNLQAVTEWSLLAEAMVLNTAARLASQRRCLVLLDVNPNLRGRSLVGVFDRVRTEPSW